MPAMANHFLLELARSPAGIAQRDEPMRRAAPLSDRTQYIVRAGDHPAVRHLHRAVSAPVAAVKHEAARRLDRATEEDRRVERIVVRDIALVEIGRAHV